MRLLLVLVSEGTHFSQDILYRTQNSAHQICLELFLRFMSRERMVKHGQYGAACEVRN